jgi:hypothetical protein
MFETKKECSFLKKSGARPAGTKKLWSCCFSVLEQPFASGKTSKVAKVFCFFFPKKKSLLSLTAKPN